jgi:hypothetical protein
MLEHIYYEQTNLASLCGRTAWAAAPYNVYNTYITPSCLWNRTPLSGVCNNTCTTCRPTL